MDPGERAKRIELMVRTVRRYNEKYKEPLPADTLYSHLDRHLGISRRTFNEYLGSAMGTVPPDLYEVWVEEKRCLWHREFVPGDVTAKLTQEKRPLEEFL